MRERLSWHIKQILCSSGQWPCQCGEMRFWNQKCGPIHNSSTCAQRIPQIPAEVVPYQSLQLFWYVAHSPPPSPPPHRTGLVCAAFEIADCGKDQCLLAAPPPLHSAICDLFNKTWKISHRELRLLSRRNRVATTPTAPRPLCKERAPEGAWRCSLPSKCKSALNWFSFFQQCWGNI